MTWAEIETKLYQIPNLVPATQSRVLFEDARGLEDGAAILEIGAYRGLSTCALAYGCIGTRKHVWTIDTFIGNVENTDIQDGPSYLDEFKHNVAAQGLDAYVTPLVGRSDEFYADWERPISLLFIDGNHADSIIRADVAAFYPWLKPGGILLMHDIFPESEFVPMPNMTFIAGSLARGVRP